MGGVWHTVHAMKIAMALLRFEFIRVQGMTVDRPRYLPTPSCSLLFYSSLLRSVMRRARGSSCGGFTRYIHSRVDCTKGIFRPTQLWESVTERAYWRQSGRNTKNSASENLNDILEKKPGVGYVRIQYVCSSLHYIQVRTNATAAFNGQKLPLSFQGLNRISS